MLNMFTKQNIIKAAVLIWIVGSIVYIGYDTWSDFKTREVQQAYQLGFGECTKQIFDKIQSSQCKQSIEIISEGNSAEVVETKCLQQQAPTNQPQQGSAQTPSASVKK